jgi:hypothetical protein
MKIRVTAMDNGGNAASDEIKIKLVEDIDEPGASESSSEEIDSQLEILNIPITFFALISIILIFILLASYLLLGKSRS